MDFIKVKNLHFSEDTVKKVKIYASDYKKI